MQPETTATPDYSQPFVRPITALVNLERRLEGDTGAHLYLDILFHDLHRSNGVVYHYTVAKRGALKAGYLGFGSRVADVVQGYEIVAMLPEHATWQTMRLQSGLMCGVNIHPTIDEARAEAVDLAKYTRH